MINSFQHIGLGVYDIDETYKFYKKFFGFKIKLNDLTVTPKEMAPVIGSLETMRMLMTLNIKGSGLLEFIEHKSSPIRPFPEHQGYGDFGIIEIGFKVKQIEAVVDKLNMEGISFLIPVCELKLEGGRKWKHTYLMDPNGILIQLVEDIHPGEEINTIPEIHGVIHVGIGVSDIEKSKKFYKDILGFDQVLYSHKGIMPGMEPIIGNSKSFNMDIIERSAPVTGPITIFSSGIIKLINVDDYPGQHIYKNRRWGDIGCMEFCMDVSSHRACVKEIKEKGVDIYLPTVNIDMGSGSKGLVAYIRDPDGTVIEFVEIETVAWISTALFLRIIMPVLRVYDRIFK